MKEEFINVTLSKANEVIKMRKPIMVDFKSRIGLVPCVNLSAVSQITEEEFIKVICQKQISGRKHVLLHPKVGDILSQIKRQFKNAGVEAEIKLENDDVHIDVPANIVIFATNRLSKFLGVPNTWQGNIVGKLSDYKPRTQSQYLYFFNETTTSEIGVRIPRKNFSSLNYLIDDI